MSLKTLGYVLIVVGIVLLVVSVFADTLGLGVVHGFGFKQVIGSIVGVVVAVVGGYLAVRKTA